MYQKTWINSQEVLLSEKSKIWERMHYTMPFCKANTDVPNVSVSMWVCAGLGEMEGNLARYIYSCYMGYLRWRRDAGGVRKEKKEIEPSKKEKKKNAFRRTPIWSQDFCIYIELCILVGICIKKYILSECLSKECDYISLLESMVCNNNLDLSSDELGAERSQDRVMISCEVSLNGWLVRWPGRLSPGPSSVSTCAVTSLLQAFISFLWNGKTKSTYDSGLLWELMRCTNAKSGHLVSKQKTKFFLLLCIFI